MNVPTQMSKLIDVVAKDVEVYVEESVDANLLLAGQWATAQTGSPSDFHQQVGWGTRLGRPRLQVLEQEQAGGGG